MANRFVSALGEALGKLISNLKNPKWYGSEVATAGMSILVIGPAAKPVKAWLKGHFHHDHGKIGDHYEDSDGNEYIVIDGKTYRHDRSTDNFYHATA